MLACLLWHKFLSFICHFFCLCWQSRLTAWSCLGQCAADFETLRQQGFFVSACFYFYVFLHIAREIFSKQTHVACFVFYFADFIGCSWQLSCLIRFFVAVKILLFWYLKHFLHYRLLLGLCLVAVALDAVKLLFSLL